MRNLELGNQIYLLAYRVHEDETVSIQRKILVYQMPENIDISGAVGMAIDNEGNFFLATTQCLDVQIFKNKDTHLGSIKISSSANNLTFGGGD